MIDALKLADELERCTEITESKGRDTFEWIFRTTEAKAIVAALRRTDTQSPPVGDPAS